MRRKARRVTRPMLTGRRRDVALGLLVGGISGFLSGLFGVGGGILIVPGLVLLMSMGQRLAHGTSLAAIVPIAAAGSLGYALDGQIDYAAVACLLAGSMVGAVLGTRALHAVPQQALRLAFAATLLLTAARMLIAEGGTSGRGDLDALTIAGLVALGLLSGVLSGLLGVGGGIVMVPALILGFGLTSVVAKGTSLLVILPTAIVGTSRNVKRANARLDLALIVGLSGVATSFLGARVSLGLDERLSAVLFALLLVGVAMRLLATARREQSRTDSEKARMVTGA